jgi:phytoene dehydrogenase-like protein
MGEKWVVVGGGFRGIVGAHLLASRKDDVVLLDGGKTLGGGLSSAPWNNFYLDRGCQLFDNSDDRTTAILLDLLGDNIEPVAVRYASVTNGVMTQGVAIPDLGAYGETIARQVLDELTEAAGRQYDESRNLQETLDARFGPTAARYLATVAYKMYRIEPADLDAAAFRLSPFRRIKFLSDAAADTLKENPVFDDLVASSSQADPMRFYRARAGAYPHRHFYPKRHGLHGFAESAGARLRELGVAMRLGQGIERVELSAHAAAAVLANGETIRADRVLWALDAGALERALLQENTIAPLVHGVPMVLHYFVIEGAAAGPFTYLQNFDVDDYVFRASIPGSYVANTHPDGLSYVCCEVPATVDSAEWRDVEGGAGRAWAQLQRHGLVRSDRPVDTLSVTTPRSYWMPRVGYGDARRALTARLQDTPRLVRTDDLAFSRSDIVASVMQALDA